MEDQGFMKAMVLQRITNMHSHPMPLALMQVPVPTPADHEVLIEIEVCGICHTEIDEIEGRTPPGKLPIIPGHQAVGKIVKTGKSVSNNQVGERVGVAWIGSACGNCNYCNSGLENLCYDFLATGRDINGGYAEFMTCDADFVHLIPAQFSASEAAPLLCAGAIGYRSLHLCGLNDGQSLGLTGFGASGHLVLKLVLHQLPNTSVYVFARNAKEREFARELGAVWVGESDSPCPEKLHAIIDTTPVWKPVIDALGNLTPGGRLVINAIRKEEIDKDELVKLQYQHHLWMEKELKSVANVTRNDVRRFLQIAAEAMIIPEIQEYSLEQANEALSEIKSGKIRGAKILRMK
jgi:propanol-preferring alcohol dehydrogenase